LNEVASESFAYPHGCQHENWHWPPDALLLDEVLAVGDAHFAEKSRAKMDEFKERGKTILLVTHDLATVENWCHQALWLEGGKVQALGDPKEVVARYKAQASATVG